MPKVHATTKTKNVTVMRTASPSTTKPKVQSPRVAAIFSKRIKDLGFAYDSDFIRKFHADHGDIGSRNHLYKILNGQAVIGEAGLLPLVVKSLGLKLDDVIKAVRADKIQSKDWAQSIPKANKTQQEVVTTMETLSPRDQEEVLRFAKMKAER